MRKKEIWREGEIGVGEGEREGEGGRAGGKTRDFGYQMFLKSPFSHGSSYHTDCPCGTAAEPEMKKWRERESESETTANALQQPKHFSSHLFGFVKCVCVNLGARPSCIIAPDWGRDCIYRQPMPSVSSAMAEREPVLQSARLRLDLISPPACVSVCLWECSSCSEVLGYKYEV